VALAVLWCTIGLAVVLLVFEITIVRSGLP